MQSRISFFNGAVYRKNLTRFAPLWIGYLALWIVIMPLAILSQGNSPYFNLIELQDLVLNFGLKGGNVINCIYAILIAMALFSWQYQSRSINTIAALPIRREAFFVTSAASALTFSVVSNLLIALLSWGASAAIGFPSLTLMLQWLGIMTLEFLFCFGLATLCAAIVGQILALPVLYFLLNFTAIVINYVSVAILATFVYGMDNSGYTYLGRFSPVYYIFSRLSVTSQTAIDANGEESVVAYIFRGWKYLGIIAAVGIILLLLAFWLFRRRRMEAAGDVIAVRPLRPVFKYCFTVGCSLVLGVLAADIFFSGYNGPSLPVMTLCLLIGGFVGYFVSEILLKKSFHVFRREWIGYGVFALCLLAAIGLMEFDVFGFERRVPDTAEVESITIRGSGYREHATITDEALITDLITLHQSIINEKGTQETLANSYDPRNGDTDIAASDFTLIYQLRSGRNLSREYTIYCDESMWRNAGSLPRQYSEIINDPDILLLASTPEYELSPAAISYGNMSYYNRDTYNWDYFDLTSEQAYTLYTTCVLPDIQDGLIGSVTPFYFEDVAPTDYMADFSIEFNHNVESPSQPGGRITLSYDYYSFTLTAGSRTAEWFEQEFDISLLLQSEFDALNENTSVDTVVG